MAMAGMLFLMAFLYNDWIDAAPSNNENWV
jgi:hypothetical protein